MNSCFGTPFYSCAVDCFLELTFRLFINYVQPTSHNQQNLFEIVTRVKPIYDVAILNSDFDLLIQVREPIWDYIIQNCPSFIPRNSDAEFSQIFSGNIFRSLASEERALFETYFKIEGVCSQCNHMNSRNNSVMVSYISEISHENFDYSRWPQFVSPTDSD